MTITIVLEREDMFLHKKNTPRDEIDISCFDIPRMFTQLAHTIHFIDDDATTTVLKQKFINK